MATPSPPSRSPVIRKETRTFTSITACQRNRSVAFAPRRPDAIPVCVRRRTRRLTDLHDTGAQKEALRSQFGGLGWECPQILAALDSCPELYFDRVSQIRMQTWSKGRVGLVGDAAFCPSLLAGQGSALAMAAAYVLAGELGATGSSPEQALKRYEERLHPFMLGKQDAAKKFAGSFTPKTRVGTFPAQPGDQGIRDSLPRQNCSWEAACSTASTCRIIRKQPANRRERTKLDNRGCVDSDVQTLSPDHFRFASPASPKGGEREKGGDGVGFFRFDPRLVGQGAAVFLEQHANEPAFFALFQRFKKKRSSKTSWPQNFSGPATIPSEAKCRRTIRSRVMVRKRGKHQEPRMFLNFSFNLN